MRQLGRFLSPQIAEAIISSDDESILRSHRSEVAVFFADLRGWTSFVDGVEPEELLRVLREFHDRIGRLVQRSRRPSAFSKATAFSSSSTIRSASGGQVLITQRLYAEVEDSVEAVSAGEFVLKGFGRPLPALDVVALRESELTEA